MLSRCGLLALCLALLSAVAVGQQATGFITISISAQQFKPQCNGGRWTIFGQNFNLAVTVQPFGGTAVTHQPMAETTQLANGVDLASISMQWFLNGVPANVVAQGTFNVGTSSTSANVWTFMVMDDQPNIGGTFVIGDANECTNGQTAPPITASFFSDSFIVGVGAPNQGIPAVSANPMIVNNLNSLNQQSNTNTNMPTAPIATTTKPATTVPTSSASANGVITITVTDNQVLTPQCLNNQWTIFLNLQLSVTVQLFGGQPVTNAPMAETVSLPNGNLATLNMQWFLGGNPATVIASNTFNVGMSMTSANVWSFMLMDDQPNIGGQIQLGSCTQGATVPAVTASFFCGQFIKGIGNNNIPAVSAIPTIANHLQPANIATINGATTTAPTPTGSATTAAATTVPTVTTTRTSPAGGQTATGTISITVAADQFRPQCQNGVWTLNSLIFRLSVTTTKFGGQPMTAQPMAETCQLANGVDLASISMAWFIGGAPANVNAQNTQSVGASSTNANVWTWMLMDDGPNEGGTFTFPNNPCQQNAAPPTITASFSSTSFIVGVGSNQIPAVSATPTIVNNLNPANIASGSVTVAPTTTTTTAAGATTAKATTAPLTTTTKAPAGGANGQITITMSDGQAFNPICSNGNWNLFGLTIGVSVSLQLFGGAVFTTMPMAEVLSTANGDLATVAMQFFVNGAATTVTASNTFNVGMSMTSGNVWSFMLMDDEPVIGGSFVLSSPCQQGQTAPPVTASFSCTSFVIGVGNGQLPAVSAVPMMVNKLQPANIQTGSIVTPMPTQPGQTTVVATTAKPTPPQTNGMITLTISDGRVLTPQCSNGQWTLFGVTMAVSVTVQQFNGAPKTTMPMAEVLSTSNGNLATVDMEWFLNGSPASVQALNTFNVGMSMTSGNVWAFNLLDDQPNIGGTITLGTCTNGQSVPTVTAAFTCNSFVIGQGIANQGIPVVNAVPTVVNALQPQNIATGSSTMAPGVTTVATTSTVKPTLTTAVAFGTSGIVFTIKDVNPIQPICSNNQWTLFGVTLSVSVTLTAGTVQKTTMPMAEIVSLANGDLASINVIWQLGGQPAAVTASNTFNVGASSTTDNIWTFMLQDDKPSYGGTFTFNSACTFNSPAPSITATFTTTAFIVGQGVANQGIPAVSGTPIIVNALPPSNQAVVVDNTNSSGTDMTTIYIIIAAAVGGALIVAAVMTACIKYRRKQAAHSTSTVQMYRDTNVANQSRPQTTAPQNQWQV